MFLQIVQAKKGAILQRCIACGHNANIDMRHKLTTFILKNPPEPVSCQIIAFVSVSKLIALFSTLLHSILLHV